MKSSLIALIIEPDVARRVRLRQALLTQGQYPTLRNAQNIYEARRQLKDNGTADIIFLGAGISREEAIEFTQESKRSPAGETAAYVRIIESGTQSLTTISLNLVGGFDGQLVEPYSVEALQEVTALALDVCHYRSINRAQYAISLLVDEIAAQLDSVAAVRHEKGEGRISMRLLQEMCYAIHSLDQELKDFFIERVTNVFQTLPSPDRFGQETANRRARSIESARRDSKVDMGTIARCLAATAM